MHWHYLYIKDFEISPSGQNEMHTKEGKGENRIKAELKKKDALSRCKETKSLFINSHLPILLLFKT